jgi:hypothetical protein
LEQNRNPNAIHRNWVVLHQICSYRWSYLFADADVSLIFLRPDHYNTCSYHELAIDQALFICWKQHQ